MVHYAYVVEVTLEKQAFRLYLLGDRMDATFGALLLPITLLLKGNLPSGKHPSLAFGILRVRRR